MVLMLYNDDFRLNLVVFVVKKVKKRQLYSRLCSYFGGGVGGGDAGGCDDGGSGLGGGCAGADSGGVGEGQIVGGKGKVEGSEGNQGC